jgi:hypothetical protein
MIHSILLIDDSDIDTLIAERVLLRSEVRVEIIKKSSAHETLDYLDGLEKKHLHFPDTILFDVEIVSKIYHHPWQSSVNER